MTLRGNKNDGTDMHSLTAKLLNISRQDAKVFNYGRFDFFFFFFFFSI